MVVLHQDRRRQQPDVADIDPAERRSDRFHFMRRNRGDRLDRDVLGEEPRQVELRDVSVADLGIAADDGDIRV